ncbi:MAG: hypothetical protein J6S74_01535 [Alphaproteobacteria bacterium]|nr:hypothetical protein [Alphaproteobacteria bacterium]
MKKTIIRLLAYFIPFPKARRRIRRELLDVYIYHPEKQKKYNKLKEQWLVKNHGKKLLPGRFEQYDLVFAIGAACPMTWELIAHKLRTFSNPFDWTAGMPPNNWTTDADVWRDTRFITKIKLLCDNLKNFFNLKDMKILSTPVIGQHHMVCNMRTGIRFKHLFPKEESIEMLWDNISEKMNRRGARLISTINSSKHVLVCWGHRIMHQIDSLDRTVSDKDIKLAVKLLHKRFPKTEIDLVFFEHDGNKKEFEYDKITVCDGAYRIVSNHQIVTNDYSVVCAPIPFFGGYITDPEPTVIAEALDNIRVID